MMILYTLLVPVFCFLAHFIACHLSPQPRSPQKRLALLSLGCVALFGLGSFFFFPEAGIFGVLYVGVVGFCLTHAYFHVFNMSETARRIRILLSTLHPEEIPPFPKEQVGPQMLERRLQRLINMGSLLMDENRYYPKKGTMLYAAKVVGLWRHLYYPSKPA